MVSFGCKMSFNSFFRVRDKYYEPINWQALYWAACRDDADAFKQLLSQTSAASETSHRLGWQSESSSFKNDLNNKTQAQVWRKSLEPGSARHGSEAYPIFELLMKNLDKGSASSCVAR